MERQNKNIAVKSQPCVGGSWLIDTVLGPAFRRYFQTFFMPWSILGVIYFFRTLLQALIIKNATQNASRSMFLNEKST